MVSLSIAASEHQSVTVEVQSYERGVTGDYHDDNWLNVIVGIKAGGFSGRFSASFLTNDFSSFHEEVSALYETLKRSATFSTMEEQLSLFLVGNGRGGIELAGTACDAPGIGNQLKFCFSIDQTHLRSLLSDLNEIKAAFPVRSAKHGNQPRSLWSLDAAPRSGAGRLFLRSTSSFSSASGQE